MTQPDTTSVLQPAFLDYELPPSLTIENAETVLAELKALPLAPGVTLRLDAARTEIMTTPGVQILLALGRSLEKAGGSLLLNDAHATVSRTFAALGVQPNFSGETDHG